MTIPEVDLTIDPSDPDGDNRWYVSIPEITLTASDNFDLENIEYRFEDDADWTVYTGPVAVTDGKRVFSYRATDKAGNVTDTGVKNVKVDTEEPDMIDDLNAKYEDGTIFLEWDVDDSDIHDVYIYRGRSKTFSKDRHSLTAKVDADDDDYEDDNTELDKTYYYKLVSRDEAGNTSDSRIISVRTPDEEGGEAIVTDEGTEPTGTGTTGGGETGIAGEEETVSETDTEAGEGEVAGEQTEPEGEVEGVSTETRNYWWILWILLAIAAGYAAYRRFVVRTNGREA